MRPLFARLILTMTWVLAASMQPAVAVPVSEEEAQKIQSVIVTQLTAFAQDDAEQAFQTATPAVREAIGTSDLFLALVRGAYPMVYRPESVTFHKPERETGGAVLELVEITDTDAKSWFALFVLERQPDSTWRISGCVVRENRWQPV